MAMGEPRAWYPETNANYIPKKHISPSLTGLIGKKSNMDILLENFHMTQNYPVIYLGKTDHTAVCLWPNTNTEEWFNIKNLVIHKPLKKGMIITAYKRQNNKLYENDVVFMRWENEEIHEWLMTNGDILHLRKDFVDGLKARDRRYMKL